MAAMTHTATYVHVTDPRRSKTFPFAEGMQPPKEIRDERTGDLFTLRAVCYEATPVGHDEVASAIRTNREALDAVQTARREWNARLYGRVVADVTASDEATTSFGQSEAA